MSTQQLLKDSPGSHSFPLSASAKQVYSCMFAAGHTARDCGIPKDTGKTEPTGPQQDNKSPLGPTNPGAGGGHLHKKNAGCTGTRNLGIVL